MAFCTHKTKLSIDGAEIFHCLFVMHTFILLRWHKIVYIFVFIFPEAYMSYSYWFVAGKLHFRKSYYFFFISFHLYLPRVYVTQFHHVVQKIASAIYLEHKVCLRSIIMPLLNEITVVLLLFFNYRNYDVQRFWDALASLAFKILSQWVSQIFLYHQSIKSI